MAALPSLLQVRGGESSHNTRTIARYPVQCIPNTVIEMIVSIGLIYSLNVVFAFSDHFTKVDVCLKLTLLIPLVKQVLTDKGADFCNKTIERWYATKGIAHTKVGPKSSQLNLVDQALIGIDNDAQLDIVLDALMLTW
ncbi:unnamed protein product [Phytophthora fragariaefolia]|uniref:Unnamed protein product n=1 Tax=Phytophthora fragariaefolia TaxID=1490495 RepID=A0A9W6U4Z0_9STRA|nr:unnamed protein product [Phytophthora fragariaefolia]